LLVCEDNNGHIGQLVFAQHRGELVLGVLHTLDVGRVDDVDNRARTVGVVIAPERAEGVLAADVPEGESQRFVLDCEREKINSVGENSEDIGQNQNSQEGIA
jgi:hypothetical protein